MQQVTELQLKLENVQLKMELLNTQVQVAQLAMPTLDTERKELVAKLEVAMKEAQEVAQAIANKKGTVVPLNARPEVLPETTKE